MAEQHRHQTPLRGVKATPHLKEASDDRYTAIHHEYAGQVGHIHEVVDIEGVQLAKVGFADKKIVFYLLEDIDLDESAKRGTFHDE